MAASSVAAAGAAVAVYFYNRRSPLFTCGAAPSADDDSDQEPSEERAFLRHTGPNNWLEALYFFAEALRQARCTGAHMPGSHASPVLKRRCPWCSTRGCMVGSVLTHEWRAGICMARHLGAGGRQTSLSGWPTWLGASWTIGRSQTLLSRASPLVGDGRDSSMLPLR